MVQTLDSWCVVTFGAQTPPFVARDSVDYVGIAAAYEIKGRRRVNERMPRVSDV
jgi:hypothetical protein